MSDDKLRLQEQIQFSCKPAAERVRFSGRVTESGEASFVIYLTDLPLEREQLSNPQLELHGSTTRADALYHFKTGLLSVEETTDGWHLQLKQPQSSWREQRRRFFRIERTLPVTVRPAGDEDTESGGKEEMSGSIVNISAGGIQLILTLPDGLQLQQGTEVLVSFNLETYRFQDVRGRILRIRDTEDNRLMGMQFMDPDGETQNRIARLNLLHERKQLKGD